MSKGGYANSFPATVEHSLPAGVDMNPGTWHKVASFCDWKSLAAASCCCPSLKLPLDLEPLRQCILNCRGPAEYPEIKRRSAHLENSDNKSGDADDDSEDVDDDSEDVDDDSADVVDNFEDLDASLYVQPMSSVNLPFVRLLCSGLLEISDTVRLDKMDGETILDQRCLSDESLHRVSVLKAQVDTLRVESTLSHFATGSGFLEFHNLRALIVHDAKWLRHVILCKTKLCNLECLALSFRNSWDADDDEKLASYLQEYHRDHFTTVGGFSFDEAWCHGLVDALPALCCLRAECRQMRSREQRAQKPSPLTSLLMAATRRSLHSLHVSVSQEPGPEQESVCRGLVDANMGTLQELTLPDTDGFQIQHWLKCQPSQLVKLVLEGFITRLEDLQCLAECRLLTELTLCFDRGLTDGMPELRLALHKLDITGAVDTVFLLRKLCLGTELRSLQLQQCHDPNDGLRQFLPSCERLQSLSFWSNYPAVLSAPPHLQELALSAGEVASSSEFTQALAEALKGRPIRSLNFHSIDSLTFIDCWHLVLRSMALERASFAHFYDDPAECSARALSPERLVADCIEHPCLKVLELASALHLPEEYPIPPGSPSSEDAYDDAGMQYWAALISLPQVRFHHRAPLALNDNGSVARDYVRLDINSNDQRSVTLILRSC